MDTVALKSRISNLDIHEAKSFETFLQIHIERSLITYGFYNFTIFAHEYIELRDKQNNNPQHIIWSIEESSYMENPFHVLSIYMSESIYNSTKYRDIYICEKNKIIDRAYDL